MKKIIMCFILLIPVLCLCACGDNKSAENPAEIIDTEDDKASKDQDESNSAEVSAEEAIIVDDEALNPTIPENGVLNAVTELVYDSYGNLLSETTEWTNEHATNSQGSFDLIPELLYWKDNGNLVYSKTVNEYDESGELSRKTEYRNNTIVIDDYVKSEEGGTQIERRLTNILII